MNTKHTSFFFDRPLYRKALDIYVLSQNISRYLNHDLANLTDNGLEDNDIYFSGDIVQQSTNLAPEILKAERERFSDKKHYHIESLNKLTYKLYKNCKRLETSKSNGKDFIPLLKNELKKFKSLQRNWMLTL